MFVMIDPDDIGDDAKDVGRRLRLTRIALGYDGGRQSDFAEEAGISQSNYNKFEKGARILTLQAAKKLCHRFGLTLDWLYRGDPSGLPNNLHTTLMKIRKEARENAARKKTGTERHQ